MDQPAYKQFVTGAPPGIVLVMEDPKTGAEYKFHGVANGALLYCIANINSHWASGDVQVINAGLSKDVQAQLAAAQGNPIQWCLQFSEQAAGIRAALASVSGISVVHVPSPDSDALEAADRAGRPGPPAS